MRPDADTLALDPSVSSGQNDSIVRSGQNVDRTGQHADRLDAQYKWRQTHDDTGDEYGGHHADRQHLVAGRDRPARFPVANDRPEGLRFQQPSPQRGRALAEACGGQDHERRRRQDRHERPDQAKRQREPSGREPEGPAEMTEQRGDPADQPSTLASARFTSRSSRSLRRTRSASWSAPIVPTLKYSACGCER
jgi:hypothetical protein